MYALRLFIVVLQEVHCLHDLAVKDFYRYAKFRLLTLVAIRELKLKKNNNDNNKKMKWTFTILTTFPESDFGHFLSTPIF